MRLAPSSASSRALRVFDSVRILSTDGDLPYSHLLQLAVRSIHVDCVNAECLYQLMYDNSSFHKILRDLLTCIELTILSEVSPTDTDTDEHWSLIRELNKLQNSLGMAPPPLLGEHAEEERH